MSVSCLLYRAPHIYCKGIMNGQRYEIKLTRITRVSVAGKKALRMKCCPDDVQADGRKVYSLG